MRVHGWNFFWWKYRVVEGCIPNFSSIGVVAPPSPEQNIFLAKHIYRTPKFGDFTSETTTNDCRSIAVAWFWCHTWYLKSAVSAVHQLQVAKLKVLHIASVAHQSSCKLGPKANADGPIQNQLLQLMVSYKLQVVRVGKTWSLLLFSECGTLIKHHKASCRFLRLKKFVSGLQGHQLSWNLVYNILTPYILTK